MEDDKILYIVETLGKLDTRTEMIERILLGNGQPGLAQKVEALEGSRNLLWGMGSAVTVLTGIFEYFWHRKL